VCRKGSAGTTQLSGESFRKIGMPSGRRERGSESGKRGGGFSLRGGKGTVRAFTKASTESEPAEL